MMDLVDFYWKEKVETGVSLDLGDIWAASELFNWALPLAKFNEPEFEFVCELWHIAVLVGLHLTSSIAAIPFVRWG